MAGMAGMAASDGKLRALIDYGDDYVQPLILSAMSSVLPPDSYDLIEARCSQSTEQESWLARLKLDSGTKLLQITPYECIDFEYAAAHAQTTVINSYMIRKALIRKHFLSATIEAWTVKHPDSALKSHSKRSEHIELDYAEFLDEALVEAFDLRASLERNAALLGSGDGRQEVGPGDEDADPTLTDGRIRPKEREWWMLKGSMSERGQGIRLFSSTEELQAIFDGWQADESESEDGDAESADGQRDEGRDEGRVQKLGSAAGITTSNLRHFVAQPYIHPPLLFPQLGNRKFHIRVYVLAVACLRVFVFHDMLALFAAKPYQAPSTNSHDLDAHLTNTCLHSAEEKVRSVHAFWTLPLAQQQKEAIFAQICTVTGDVFEAAARESVVHFQPLAHAFEVYGLDFLLDAQGTAWLLEVNAFPDFGQTGHLRDVVEAFWRGVVRRAVWPFVGTCQDQHQHDDGMILVRDLHLGRRS